MSIWEYAKPILSGDQPETMKLCSQLEDLQSQFTVRNKEIDQVLKDPISSASLSINLAIQFGIDSLENFYVKLWFLILSLIYTFHLFWKLIKFLIKYFISYCIKWFSLYILVSFPYIFKRKMKIWS